MTPLTLVLAEWLAIQRAHLPEVQYANRLLTGPDGHQIHGPKVRDEGETRFVGSNPRCGQGWLDQDRRLTVEGRTTPARRGEPYACPHRKCDRQLACGAHGLHPKRVARLFPDGHARDRHWKRTDHLVGQLLNHRLDAKEVRVRSQSQALASVLTAPSRRLRRPPPAGG